MHCAKKTQEPRILVSCSRISAGSVKDGAWQAHDAILEMLNLHGAGQQKLGSGDMGPGNASAPGPVKGAGQGSPGAGAAAGEEERCLMEGDHVMHLLNNPESGALCQAQPMKGLAWGWVWIRSGVDARCKASAVMYERHSNVPG